MYYRKIKEDLDCGIVLASKVFGGKWKPCIIDAINKGHKRPTELHKIIAGAPKRVIDLQLRELVATGVLKRVRGNGFPLCTHYELTDSGKSIMPIIEAMDQWGNQHKNLIRQYAQAQLQ